MKFLLHFIIMFPALIFAQISITNNDIANMFAVGNSVTIHENEGSATINIGSPGGGNSWDFSALQSNSTFDLLSVDPSTTPHIGEFPGAEIAAYSMSEFEGEEAEIWSYFTLNGAFDNMGSAITVSSQPGILTTIKNNPARVEVELPMTFNSSWMQQYTQTLFINGVQFFQSSVSLDVIVDAYGTMTLPGGAGFDALRIREEMTVSGITSVTYSFRSKSGAVVVLQASDSNPPSSGDINVDGYSWNLSVTTSVEQISRLPENFSLSQNYPNPFNPSTKIEYSLPEQSFVQLKVYDVLGNEVATLVNEEQSAGLYKVEFSAVNLSSGFYVAQLKSGNSIKTIKMTLLK
jgi:hypothetical protein